MELVNFNYDHFKAGRPVVTRDGKRVIPFELDNKEDAEYALCTGTFTYTIKGELLKGSEYRNDLMHPADPKWDNPGALTCIFCGKDATKENPYLVSVNAPGNYWQHWGPSCKENTHNIGPNGDTPQVTPEVIHEDRDLWQTYFLTLLPSSKGYTKETAKEADDCLAEYKKRWAKL